MDYAPIESYGLIGNMRTAALVGENGCIDWLCLPDFDSPSVFAAILDHRKGGRFQIMAEPAKLTVQQFYVPDTNVLVTRLRTDDAVGEVLDFMPVGESRHDRRRPALVRIVRMKYGRIRFNLRCHPAFDYARSKHRVNVNGCGAVFDYNGGALLLSATVDLHADEQGVAGHFELEGDETAAFAIMRHEPDEPCDEAVSVKEADELLHDTIEFWRHWINHCTYTGRWREWVRRSALALKLLTYEPTGAIVAAPTTSLPEHVGGERNWDYRYTWLRDAAFTIFALQKIGFSEEAGGFMNWLHQRCHELEPGRMLRPVYGIDGRHELPEEELHHLEGYRGSQPVRIGNAAYDQLQLDIAGTLLDAIYLHNKHGTPTSHDLWIELRKILNWVCDNWQRKDHGVWEVRSEMQHFVNSKLMCWVALDRGVRLSDERGFPAERRKWLRHRDAIYREIMTNGWNDSVGAFTHHYETKALDASNLIMPLVFFISPNDPRMLSTIRAMARSPKEGGLVSDLVVYRYDVERSPDGLEGPEGAFNMCTFWMAEALTRAGRTDPECLERGRLLFERMLAGASHVGLFAEQAGWRGEALGNYPQGLTHLSLITAAYHLDHALDEHGL